jgi:hypothetical protein
MGNQSFELPMSSTRLRVTEVSNGWWQWVLLRPEGDIVLGADALADRRASIRAKLDDGPSAGKVDGVPVRWILSLFENHHSLYAGDDGDNRLLYFQDRDGHVVWRDRLLAEHRREWALKIDDLPGDRPKSR